MQESTCHKCGAKIVASSKFCGNCGAAVQKARDSERGSSKQSEEQPDQAIVCSLCGQKNPPQSMYCSSCGSAIGTGAKSQPGKSRRAERGSSPSKPRPLNLLQSWKLLATLGVVFVIILIATNTSLLKKDTTDPHASSPQAMTAMNDVKTLQAEIERDPKNDQAILHLANLYYDMKLFPKAIPMYDRYLAITPSNADARVDLGTSYFQLAMTDSVHKTELFANAKREMEKALTYVPKHQMACFNLGMVSLHSGNTSEAKEWFSKCVALDPKSESGLKAKELINQINPSP